MTQAAMVPYKRTPPPLPLRVFFRVLLSVMGVVYWSLQRFKLEGRMFAGMRERQKNELKTKNPFKGYEPTEHDVFVVTYVKSGTNWMMQLAHQLLFHGAGEFDHIHSVVAWPDTVLMGPLQGYAIPLADPRVWQASPEQKRVIKTHFAWADVPYSPKAKYIIVIRDPKDVFVSSYHFFVKDGPFRSLGMSPAEFLEIFLSEHFFMGGSWAAATAAYWAQRDKPNVLICSFKEMRRDLAGSVKRVAAFLGVDASPEVLSKVTELASFAYMKTIDDKFSTGNFLSVGTVAPMMRKGSDGGSSELITPAQARRIDEYFLGELRRIGSDFPYEEFCRISPDVTVGAAAQPAIARA